MGYFQHAISSRSVGSFVFCVDVWTCGLVGGWWLIMRKFSADEWHVACHLLTWTLFGRPVLPIHPPFLKRVSFFAYCRGAGLLETKKFQEAMKQ